MEILRHLQEIERRKLYCDLGYGSLFDYAVGELKYSEASAGRRLQAMKLLAEIPEVAPRIESGTLSLTNVCQAQVFFRDLKKTHPEHALNKEEKKEILEKLDQKSAREGQKVLLELGGPTVLPRERERIVSSDHTEVRFLVNKELQSKLDEVRALLGPKGSLMSFAELVAEMAELSSERLAEKRFGKKRVRSAALSDAPQAATGMPRTAIDKALLPENEAIPSSQPSTSGAGSEKSEHDWIDQSKISRHVPRAIKYQVWQRVGGKCSGCGSKRDLQFDHIQPAALGGASSPENIQLLCRSCNIRRGVKTFGTRAMKRA